MQLTREQLLKISHDPSVMQRDIYQYIKQASEGKLVVTDPTNPFSMLMEAIAVTGANSIIEPTNIIRKAYPSLAISHDDLYHHLSDDELANMFAIPAETSIVFYVNLLDLKTTGHRPDGTYYMETTIPEGTEVSVLGVSLTLLNDVVVRLYDNATVFVEQQQNDNDIAYENIGILSAGITTDNETVPWIVFETKLKQVKKITKNIAVTASGGFTHTMTMADKFYYTEVSYKNETTDGEYVKLNRCFNEEYIDPLTPSVFISIKGNEITYKIPDVYLIDGSISGTINIDLYETKGSLYLPINKYTIEDYSVVLGNTGKNISSATSTNMAILANSRGILQGGKDNMSVSELRRSIIFNTTGDIDLPITDYQIERSQEMHGYEVFKSLDVVTERLYVAARNLPAYDSELILAKHDIFFNTAEITLDELTTHYNVNILNQDFVIKSNTLFKENNGRVNIVCKDELTYMDSLNTTQLIAFLKHNKLFYTPYYYIVRTDPSYSTSRVYDLDRPTLKDLRIVGKNITVNQRVNIDKFAILKIENGYKIVFSLVTNAEFDELDPNLIGMQIKMELLGDNEHVFIEATRDVTTGYFEAIIETDLFIDENNFIDLKNGKANLFSKRIHIDNEITVYIYTKDEGVVDTTNYLLDEIDRERYTKYCVFSKELLKIELGRQVEYIWNRLYNSFTERRYKRYDYDIPLIYTDDVYEIDPDTGKTLKCETDPATGEKVITRNLLHKRGDVVKNELGEITYKHRKGDVIVDENNLPILDVLSGVVRYVDILMLEYEFKAATSNAYSNYRDMVMDILDSYLFKDLPSMNSKLLENTRLLYKSYKTNKNAIVNINNVYYSMPYIVRPTVTLYVSNQVTLDIPDIENYRNLVGKVINEHLDKAIITVEDIKKDIKNTIGEIVVAVKVSNIDVNNSEIIAMKDLTTRLVLNKVLDMNKNYETVVRYDVNVLIQYV